MSFANTTENYVMDHIAGTSWTAPTALYIKLHTGDPGEDCTSLPSAETTRKVVTFGAASGGTVTSNSTASWTSWTAGSETISHVSIWTHLTAGYPVMYGGLDSPRDMENDDTLTISSGNLTLSAS